MQGEKHGEDKRPHLRRLIITVFIIDETLRKKYSPLHTDSCSMTQVIYGFLSDNVKLSPTAEQIKADHIFEFLDTFPTTKMSNNPIKINVNG